MKRAMTGDERPTSKKCDHANVHFHINHHRSGDTNVAYAELKCSCRDCGVDFVFRGLDLGSSPDRPMASADRTEIRIPMIGKGEAVVGNPSGYVLTFGKDTEH